MTTTTPTYTVGQRVIVTITWTGKSGPGTISRIAGDVAYVVLDEDRDAAAAGTGEAVFAGVVPCLLADLKPEPTI